MKRSLFLLVGLLMIAHAVFSQQVLSDEDARGIIAGTSITLEYFDSWDKEDFSKFYPLIKDSSYGRTRLWVVDLQNRDLSLNLDDPQKNVIGLGFFGKKFTIDFRRDQANSDNVLVRIWDATNNRTCYLPAQNPVGAYVSKDLDYTSNTEFYGQACGIKVLANWESFIGGSFRPDIDVEFVQIDESALVPIVKDFFGKRKNNRFYDEQAGNLAAEQIFHHLVINYSGSSQNEDMKILTPELRPDPSEPQQYLSTNLAEYRASSLPFDIDRPSDNENSMLVSYLDQKWQITISQVSGQTVKYQVNKTGSLPCPNGGYFDSVDVPLFLFESKWSSPVCGLRFAATWEWGFEDDMEINGIAIQRQVIGKSAADHLKGKNLAAILKYTGELKEINELVRTIDIYDSTKFQGDQEKRMYTGEPIYFEENSKLDFFDDVKNKYLAVTANKRLLYVLYARPEWGTNQLWVAKAKKEDNFILGRKDKGANISTVEELGTAISTLEELSDKAVELNLDNVDSLLATAEIKNLQDTKVQLVSQPKGPSPLVQKDYETALQQIKGDREQLAQVWETLKNEESVSLSAPGLSWQEGTAVGTTLTANALSHALAARQPPWPAVVSRFGTRITTLAGRLPAGLRNFGTRVGNLPALTNTRLWQGIFRAGYANEIVRIDRALTRLEVLLQGWNAGGLSAAARGSAEVTAIRTAAAAARTELAAARAAMPVVSTSRNYQTAVQATRALRTQFGRVSAAAEAARIAAASGTSTTGLAATQVTRLETAVGEAANLRRVARTARAVELAASTGGKALRLGAGLWRGARLLLIPAGPVGWAVFAVMGAVDVGIMMYDYSATHSFAYDDARLIVNWDREFWGASEVKMNFLIYNGADAPYEGPTVSFLDFDQNTQDKLKEFGVVSLQDVLSDKRVKLSVYELSSPEVYQKKENDLEIKLKVVTGFGADGKPVEAEETAVVLNGKTTGKRLSLERFEDPSNPSDSVETIGVHDVVPGLYGAKWTVDGKEYWTVFAIGIDDYPNAPEIFPEI